MVQAQTQPYCWPLRKFSPFYAHFAIIDTGKYLADALFIKHQVRFSFGREYFRAGSPYRVIMCKCRKHDVPKFLSAIEELPNKMLLCGNVDYLTYCASLLDQMEAALENGGVHSNESTCSTVQAE